MTRRPFDRAWATMPTARRLKVCERSSQFAQPDVSANSSFMSIALQFLRQRFTQIVIVAFTGVADSRFNGARPFHQRVIIDRAHTLGNKLRRDSLRRFAELLGAILQAAKDRVGYLN